MCMPQDECSDIRQMEPSAVDGGRNTRILCPGAVRRDVVHRLMGCPSLDILSGRTEGVRRNHPATVIEEGSEAIVNNVPVTLFECQELPEGVKAEVIERESSIDRLLEEKERLEKRLLEIEEILKKSKEI